MSTVRSDSTPPGLPGPMRLPRPDPMPVPGPVQGPDPTSALVPALGPDQTPVPDPAQALGRIPAPDPAVLSVAVVPAAPLGAADPVAPSVAAGLPGDVPAAPLVVADPVVRLAADVPWAAVAALWVAVAAADADNKQNSPSADGRRAVLLAPQTGFEPAAFRLGVAPI